MNKKKIKNIIIIVVVIIIAFMIGYTFGQASCSTKDSDSDSCTLSTKFDLSRLNYDTKDGYTTIYLDNEKLNINNVTSISDVKELNDIAMFNAIINDNKVLYVINYNGEVLNHFDASKLTGKSYDGSFDIKDDNIYITSNNVENSFDNVCNYKDDVIEYQDTIKYQNGGITKLKKHKKISTKEYIKDNNISCN